MFTGGVRFNSVMRGVRSLLLALVAMMLIPALASAQDTVINPGAFKAEINGGTLKLKDLEIPVSEIQPAPTVTGTIDKNGNVHIPSASVNFPPLTFDLGGNAITVRMLPTGTDWVGSINPDSGEFELEVRLRIKMEGSPQGIALGGSCYIGAAGTGNNLHLNPLTTGIIPENGLMSGMEGTPYHPGTGEVTTVNNTATVPGASGCGPLNLADGTINSTLGLPSGSGNNAISLEITFVETAGAPGGPQPAAYGVYSAEGPAPDGDLGGFVPLEIDFDASASASNIGPIDEYLWDFDGDGQVDQVTTDPNISHTFEEAGVMRPRLSVRSGDFTSSPRSYRTVTARSIEVTFTETPPALSNGQTADISFGTDNEGATFECGLTRDGEPVPMDPEAEEGDPVPEWTPCSSPLRLEDLSDAGYALSVRATTADGETTGLAKTIEFRIDNVPPVTTINAKPAAFVNYTEFSLLFSSNELNSAFECRMLQEVLADPENPDAGNAPEAEFESCSSPHEIQWQPIEGPVSFEVRATDPAGNLGDVVTAEWVYDATPPTMEITSGPPVETNNGIGGQVFQDCEERLIFNICFNSNYEWATPGNRVHQFNFASEDPTATFICEFTNGNGVIDNGRYHSSNYTSSALVPAAVPERVCASGVQTGSGYSTNGTGNTKSKSGSLLRLPLTDGENTLRVWAVDKAGNRSVEPSVYSFKSDRTAPRVTAAAQPAEFTKAVNNTVVFQIDEPAAIQCRVINNTGAGVTGFAANLTGFTDCNPGAMTPTLGWQVAEGQTEGRKGLQVRGTDQYGNAPAAANLAAGGALTVYWTVDNTAPTVSFDTGTIEQGINTLDTEATIKLKAADTPINFGVAANGVPAQTPDYECSLNDAPFTECEALIEMQDLAQGPQSFKVKVNDQAGNVSQIIERRWTVSGKSNASVTLTQRPAALLGERDATYAFTPDDGTAECRIDATVAQNQNDSGWTACTSPKTFTGVADGRHKVEIRKDSSSIPAVHHFAVYAAVPVATVNSQPGIKRADGIWYTGLATNEWEMGFTAPANPEFAPGATRFECRYYEQGEGSAPWYTCESPAPVEWDETEDGTVKVFEVRPVSSTGNVGAVKTASWKIMSTRPEVRLGNVAGDTISACGNGLVNGPGPAGCVATASSTQPAPLTGVVSPRFQAVSTKPVPGAIGFACQLNDGPVQTTCSGRSSGFPAGGNPLTLIVNGARGNNDNNGNSAQAGPYNLDGENTLRIWAVDHAGNFSEEPASYTWVSDRTVPTFAITSETPARTNKATADDPLEVAIESSEDLPADIGFACRLIPNGVAGTNPTAQGTNPNTPTGGWSHCTQDGPREASWSADDLAEGNYALDIRGWDLVWHTENRIAAAQRPVVTDNSPYGRRYLFTIDRTAPTVNITEGPAEEALVPQTAGEFKFTASDPAAQTERNDCRIDPADPDDVDTDDWTECTDTYEFSELEDGQHVFQVRSLDTAGNLGDPTTRTWQIDSTQPELDLSSDLNGAITNQTAVEFSFTVDPADAEVECRLAGMPGDWEDPYGKVTGIGWADPAEALDEFVTCTSPVNLGDMIDGEYSLEIRAINDIGAVSDTAVKAWTVDTVAPVATIEATPAAETNQDEARFEFSSDEAGSTFECRLDQAATVNCASPHDYTGLSDGDHTFTVTPTDPAGNAGAPVSYSWHVDTVAPVTTVTSGPEGTVAVPTAEIEFSADKAGSTFECKFGEGAWENCTSPKQLTGLTNGLQTFRVRATDPLGNVGSDAERNWAVSIPKCPPGQLGEWPDCREQVCPDGEIGTPPNCEKPPPAECPEGQVGTPPDCQTPPAKCEKGQIGTPPNCITPLPPKKPDNITGAYDPATGKLALRLKCPAAMKPKCIGNAVAVTARGKKGKVMSSKVKSNSKAGKWKLVTITIKPKYRATVESWTAIDQKKLVIRQTVKSKNKKKRNLFQKYKVRVKV